MAKKRKYPAAPPRAGGQAPRPVDAQGRLSVLIEFRHMPGTSGAHVMGMARDATAAFTVDEEYEPVSLRVAPSDGLEAGATGVDFAITAETYVVRGTVATEADLAKVREHRDVASVWIDTPIAPFPADLRDPTVDPQPTPAAAACPIPPCDCASGTAKGTIADVATYLGVNKVWAAGFRGNGIVVAVVDSGITAQGRPVKAGETPRRIPRVIGGWPADWGTESSQWGDHGNMCSTDVLGMAPDAQLYDLRVAGPGESPGTISRALQAFNWAISQHRLNGTPHVISNSWGIFQESWDTTYARNPGHPFTRKVVEAIGEGILVLFAAGNCGDTCPDGRCGPDVGPNRSIWGANGHPLVMTVGAVNRLEQFVGYSSRGPAALDPNKPDFCSITHFAGYTPSDSGTSAATPILAGAVALLKQAKPTGTQDEIKQALRNTAKDIGPTGFDTHSGAGIVQIHAAFTQLMQRPTVPPQCVFQTTPPQCPPPTHPIRCAQTHPPQCILQTTPPQCTPLTQPPRCLPQTQPPQCVLQTTPPQCLPATLPPGCLPRTLPPQCLRVTLAACPRPTLACFATPGVPGQQPAHYGAPYGYGYPMYAPYGPGAPDYTSAYGRSGYDPTAGYGFPHAFDTGAAYYGTAPAGMDPYSAADPMGYAAAGYQQDPVYQQGAAYPAGPGYQPANYQQGPGYQPGAAYPSDPGYQPWPPVQAQYGSEGASYAGEQWTGVPADPEGRFGR